MSSVVVTLKIRTEGMLIIGITAGKKEVPIFIEICVHTHKKKKKKRHDVTLYNYV